MSSSLLYLPAEYSISKAVEKIRADLSRKGIGTNLAHFHIEDCLTEFNGDILASSVFLEKYALKDKDGNLLEYTLSQAKDRWAAAIACCSREKFGENTRSTYFRTLYDYFLPAGRQMIGLGNDQVNNLSLSNCYANEIAGDSLEGIFGAAYDIAKTYAFAGGQGLDLSVLRPKNSITSNAAGSSTGSVSFGELFSYITGKIAQHGRRGALILLMRVDHPDIREFVKAKVGTTDRIRFANISVKITDDFMERVEQNKKIELWFDTPHKKHREKVPAREIWKLIATSACQSAEPGIMFWDTVKRHSPSEIYDSLQLNASNPCGELPLEYYGACCLGSLVLDMFVEKPFTPEAKFNYPDFKEITKRAVVHLDNIVELNLDKHPLKRQKEQAAKGRRIGLGFCGLADCLAALGIIYGSQQSFEFVETMMKAKMTAEYLASIELAKTRGAFPLCDKDRHYEQEFTKQLPAYVIEQGKQYGQRNVSLSAVAPTGSISLMAQCSSGIEPIFQREYERVVELGEKRRSYTVFHHGIKRAAQILNLDPVEIPTELFPSAYEINPQDKIKLVSIVQRYIDSSISQTVNLPRETTPEQVGDIYFSAWRSNLKGLTVYVEGSREGILLRKGKIKKLTDLDTKTHRFIAEGGDKFYVHVSYRNENITEPYQIFITNYIKQENDRFTKLANDLRRALAESPKVNKNKLEEQLDRSNNSLEKITRLTSLALKSNELELIVKVMEPHAFAGTLASRLLTILEPSINKTNLCPDCKKAQLVQQEGCATCPSCGYSRCNG